MRILLLLLLLMPLLIPATGLAEDLDVGVLKRELMTKDIARLSLSGRRMVMAELPSDQIKENPKEGNGIALQVEYEDREYLLGEPVWIRCSLINTTPKPITISYGRYEGWNEILFDIRGSQKTPVPRHPLGKRDSLGPKPITIEPGERLVEMFNLLDEYEIHQAGRYEVTVQYNSDGKCSRFDQAGKYLGKAQFTKCNLKQSLKTINIVKPKRDVDRAALELLSADSKYMRNRSTSPIRYANVFMEEPKRKELIKEHQDSYYTTYARFYEALHQLQEVERTTNTEYAKKAVTQFEAIDASGYPKLFQEYVLFHLVQAHVYADSDAKQIEPQIKKFRELYPDSPLLPLLTVTIEREVPAKPTSGRGKNTVLVRDNVVVGERQYYDNDVLFEERLYSNTKKEGDWTLQGESRKWHRNGNIWQVFTYEKGALNGICISYAPDGEQLAWCNLEKGNGILKTFHSNSQLESECSYLNGQRHGNERRWSKEGNLFSDSAYKLGKLHGPSRSYHPEGKKKSTATFQNGQLHGTYSIWNEAGEFVNSYQLSEKDTPADYSEREVSPYYYVNGKKVTREAYQAAAANDPNL